MHSRSPIPAVDDDGRPIFRIPLNDNTDALVDVSDHQRLTAAGITSRWFINGDGQGRLYVRCGNPVATVGRLITQACPGDRVRYANGNPRDLRRTNLHLIKSQKGCSL